MARTYRKEYTGSKAFDASCRSGGSCPACKEGRQHKHDKRKASADDQVKDLQ